MRQLNSMGANLMASEFYDKVDPEEIIIKLKEILRYFQKKKSEDEEMKKENEKKLTDSPIPGN